ncbi:MAG: methylase N-4/N-6 domain protein [Candidatus Falkowbacteria bacterium GW2011_GWF2_39_8]|uniref:Methylase N-4/N-6 domain protein n=1 Tax=Candidatus Falkowbacteria bacterium GW2011_GWF2_39_8 TaxID=1618642 RepID=A0A0G0PYY5_9BACT|nr:MAG: methylase N-4/N-6 domain protein [Candidatus Falkowbacteria bacterium GW2011_GWF2_39_8]
MKNLQAAKPKKSIKAGQIWQLGDHRLACGSSLDAELVNRLIDNLKINAIISDPPYGVSVVEAKEGFSQLKVNKKILNDNISSEKDYCTFSKEWLCLVTPHLTKKNSIYIFNSDKMLFALKQALDELGIYFSQLIIWVKNHAVIGRKDYLPQHELILFGWFGTHLFRRSKDKSVLFYPKPNKSNMHPTTKPIELISRIILNSTNIGEIVFDGFGGSGTCLIAAELTKRCCLMVEYDLEYCEIIMKRWTHLTKQEPKLIYEKY